MGGGGSRRPNVHRNARVNNNYTHSREAGIHFESGSATNTMRNAPVVQVGGSLPLPSDDGHSLTDLPEIGVNLDEKHVVYIGGDDTLSRLLVFDNEGFSRKNYDSIH